MAQITMKIEGLEKVVNRMSQYVNDSKKRVRNTVAETLLLIESDAKTLAPVDAGYLRSSIHANFSGELAGTVSANADYAIHVEFGTSRMRAQPFLTPAYQQNKQEFLRNLKQAIKYKGF